MATSGQHPRKEVRKALADAEKAGFVAVPLSGHSWGYLVCPGCQIKFYIQSTPKDESESRKLIAGFVAKHRRHS